MKKRIFFFVVFIVFTMGWNGWSAESTPSNSEAPHATMTAVGSVIPQGGKPQADSPNYPLFRPHRQEYYPPKIRRTAMLLSATLPGLGQTYAGRPGKGFAFLAVGVGLMAAGGFNLDRAVHYDDLADRFNTGFYDPHGDAFLTADQGHVKSRNHARFGALFLAGGVGIYIWNIFDAAKTVNQYNERRFPVHVQQTAYGDTYLTESHRF